MQNASLKETEQQILQAIQHQETLDKGFRLLMATYNEKLYWAIRRLVIEHEDTNDVLQNCLLKVHKSIKKFKGQSSLYTWLYRIATNEAITFLKKQKKRSFTSIEDQETNLANRLEADPYFDGNALQIRLQQILVQLPEKQRLVFNMRYFEEMPYDQISEVLGTSVGALKASYHHAAKKIELKLKNGVMV